MKPGSLVAAIVAHPDDEVLACGATLARHSDAGDRVCVLILATGATSRSGFSAEETEQLEQKAQKAGNILGIDTIDFGQFPDNKLDTIPLLEVTQRVEAFLSAFPATTVYTHHSGDLNIDHQICHRAVITALRPKPGTKTTTILAGEVLSSTEWGSLMSKPFVPTEFVDITSTLERKIRAMKCYTKELRDWPHPRSEEGIRTLARLRGGQSGLGCAEAFATLRRLQIS
jgi:LmbE family N-acetylglucosaminyl deacetylase